MIVYLYIIKARRENDESERMVSLVSSPKLSSSTFNHFSGEDDRIYSESNPRYVDGKDVIPASFAEATSCHVSPVSQVKLCLLLFEFEFEIVLVFLVW